MMVNFKTKTINLNELKKSEKTILMIEGDIIVPDVNPDIGSILLTDAVPSITNKNYSNGKVTVSGVVFVNILYVPEKEGDDTPNLKSINTKLDFKDVIDCNYDNPNISAKINVESIDFTLLNSRKLNIKIVAGISMKAYVPKTMMFATDEGENSEVETKKQNVNIHSMVADLQKDLTFTESIDVPSAKCDIEEILKTNVSVQKGECKIMDNKILLRGTLNISTLYSGFDDGFIHECMEHEIPFSEMVDVEGLAEGCMCNVSYDLKDFSTSVVNDLNGDPRVVDLTITFCVNITASQTYDLDVIDDCYCPGKVCNIKKETQSLRRSINEGASRVALKNMLSVADDEPAIAKIYSVNAVVVVRECIASENQLVIKGDITAFILYSDGSQENELHSMIREFPFEHAVDVDDINQMMLYECDASVTGTSFNIISESEVEVRVGVEFYVRITDGFDMDMVSECEITGATDDSRLAPRLIIYFVQKGDTLWNIAKHYNTTVKKIMDANHIDDRIVPGQKILIPAR